MNELEKTNQIPYYNVCESIRKDYDYGDIVSLEHIMELCGDPKPSDEDTAKAMEEWAMRRMIHMDKIATILLTEFKVCLSSVRGKGYMLVQPHNQADHALKETLNSMNKGLKKGAAIISNINITLLSDVERNHAQAVDNQMSIMQSMMSKHIQKAERIAKILSE